MQTTIQMSFDDSILTSLKCDKNRFVENMKFNNALIIYKKNQLSLGKAAELAGYDRIEFIKKMQEENVSVFDYDTEMINNIIEDSTSLEIIMNKQK